MTCETLALPGGGRAIVCGPRGHAQRCRCGRRATQLCDWKLPGKVDGDFVKVTGTCDAPLCDRCSHVPAPDKDICPKHAALWLERRAQARAS